MKYLCRKATVLAAMAFLVLGFASQASAMSISQISVDLVDIFDTNNSGQIEFGDDGSCDFKEATSVTKSFTLTEAALPNSKVTISMVYNGFDPSSMDSDTYFKLNGTSYDALSESVSSMTWVVDPDAVNLGSNTIKIYLSNFDYWLGEHYEDFNVTSWTISYFALVDDPAPEVPVPAAVWLLGSGLAGLAGLRRKKQA